ncbi:MAG: RNA polymerase sigma factor [Burkholderiales bacterium]
MKKTSFCHQETIGSANDEKHTSATAPTDRQLLDSFATGDPLALCVLINRYQNYLHKQCRILMRGNSDDAKDLFSLVILKFYSEQPEQLRKVRHLGGWLNRVARNKYIDILRERQADERRDQGLGYLDQTLENFPPSPEQIAINAELSRQLHSAFEQLPDRIRLAAKLRFEEDASYETISSALDISQVCARKRVQDARRLLASSLGRYLDTGRPPRRSGKPAACRPPLNKKPTARKSAFDDKGNGDLL